MKRDFPVPTNPEDYIYVSQLLQAYGITKGIKAHRAAKPYNMGSLYWQLNDCWPAVSWSSIDGLGNWKALHYKVKQAFENRIIVPFEQNNFLKIKVVDDGPETLKAPMQVLFYDFSGNILHQTPTRSVRTFNEKNQVVYQVDLREINFDPKQTYAKVLFGAIQEIHYFKKPKDLRLPMEGFEIKTNTVSQGIEISLKATTLQKNVFLYTNTPGHFTDNFFDLLPGQEKKIIFETKEPQSTMLQYKTLNAL
jgi:beta-mannosidase